MTRTQRLTVSGPFAIQKLGSRAWRLTSGAAGTEIYLQSSSNEVDDALLDRDIAELAVEWRERGVVVAIGRVRGRRIIEASTVIVHEGKRRLYDNLPLASFDSKAAQFWRRIFILMRLPGGRYLLKIIARRRY